MGSIRLFKKLATFQVLALQILLLLLNFVDYSYSDYEEAWISYNEQPCCMGGSNQDHIRHYKDHVKDFSCGSLHYKTFYLDENNNALYVGAMDHIFRLNVNNINQSSCKRDVLILKPSVADLSNCIDNGKFENAGCGNHIRVIQPMDSGKRLYVCGTNAHNPEDYVINANLTLSDHVPGIGLGLTKCAYDPTDNSTAVYVEKGNPFGLPALYSGINAELSHGYSAIFRSDLYNMTTGYKVHGFKVTMPDSKWLDTPNFVGSFDIGDYVYFFFRENAVEYNNFGKAVYSRIARVCKNDRGGKYRTGRYWATYLKARINCSIASEFPVYFNEIQSVYKMPHDDTKFYATFTTNTNGRADSAVCSYDIRDINAAFEGRFKEQASTNAWLPVLSNRVPEPRPGTCVSDTSALPDSVLTFIFGHPLMDKAIDHEFGSPVFYKRDIILTKLVVDKIRIDKQNGEYLVYFIGTATGKIYKIVQFISNGQRQSNLFDILEVGNNEPIREMGISQKTGSLYLATDHVVKQIDLAMCARRYDSCYRCASDPYCGWDRDAGTCKPYQVGLLQDVANEVYGICDASVIEKKTIVVPYGQPLYLSCFVKVPEVLKQKKVRWYHHPTEKGLYKIVYTPSKYIETSEGGLGVLSITEGDAGVYYSHLNGMLLCSYNVIVDTDRCSTPPWNKNGYSRMYSHWCNKVQKLKSVYNNIKQLKSKIWTI